MPAGACDTHAHVFGPPGRFPLVPDPGYLPPPADARAYAAMLDALGLARCVVIQPSVYGIDNTALLEAIAALGPRARGVAVVPPDVAEAELDRLHAGGVRGVRLSNLSPHGVSHDHLEALARRVRGRGWNVQLLLNASEISALLPRIATLDVPVVIDHMARLGPVGPGNPELARLCAAAALPHVWVKISGAEARSRGAAPWRDIDAAVAALVDAAGIDRLLWGTDWPHPSSGAPIANDGDLLGLLGRWLPDPAARRRVLAENPARLFGFP